MNSRLLLLLLMLPLSACSSYLFYPTNDWKTDPSQHGYSYQNLHVEATDGIQLNAWLMPATTPVKKGALLFFHANSMNIGYHVAQVFWLTDQGYDVMLMEYRGFGHSQGEADVDKIIIDIHTSLEFFLQRYAGDHPRYVLGQSLGAAMAGYVLANNQALLQQFDAVILDSAFSNYGRITREVLSKQWVTWLLQYPASWTMPGRYDLLDDIANIAPTPLLIMHGRGDTLVTFDHAQRLYAAAQQPKFLWPYDGQHISGFMQEPSRQALLRFLQKKSPQQTPELQAGDK